MSDYDENFMDIWSDCDPLSSPIIREVLGIHDPNENGLNPISNTFLQTNVSTDPQSEQRCGSFRDRLVIRRGFNVPPLEIESISSFANSFRNQILVPSPILEISPGFSSLSSFLQSPNMVSNSSSHIIPPRPIPNARPPETVISSGGAHPTMMISSNNIPHQTMDVDLPTQGVSDNIPMDETSVYITSHESNADPIGALLVPSIASEVVAGTDAMNLISLESCSEDKDKEDNKEEDKDEDNNIVVEPSSRKTRSYYRCTYTGCKVKKRVQRSADNMKLVIATYDGIHEHIPPPEHKRKSGTKNKSSSSKSQDPSNQTLGLGVLSSSFTASQLFSSPFAPQLDMTQYYISGLSMLTSLPVNKNHSVMNRDDEPNIDRVIPYGTEVFKEIRERLSRNLGLNL